MNVYVIFLVNVSLPHYGLSTRRAGAILLDSLWRAWFLPLPLPRPRPRQCLTHRMSTGQVWQAVCFFVGSNICMGSVLHFCKFRNVAFYGSPETGKRFTITALTRYLLSWPSSPWESKLVNMQKHIYKK